MKKSGCLSYIIVIIIAFIAAFWIAGYLEDNPIELPNFDDIFPSSPDSSNSDGNGGGYIPPSTSEGFTYYDQLNDEEKYIYNAFHEGINDGDISFKFKDVNCEEYEEYSFKALRALTYDHPEYFWLKCGIRHTSSHSLFSETGTVTAELMYYDFWEFNLSKDQKIRELESAVNEVASMALQIDSDFERVKFVHDYLIENAIYDHDGLNEYYKTVHDASCEYIFTAYGCLINKKTVCSGYAKAFQLIMEKMGYDCLYVVGYAGESHAWNMVFIEGEGYYFDITWDDADFDDGERPIYDYFGITTERLERTHAIDEDFTLPMCTAEKYDYFNYTNSHVDVYDFDQVKNIIESQRNNDVIHIRFGSAKDMVRATQDMFENQKLFSVDPFTNVTSYRYIKNESLFTLGFLLK